MRRSLFYSVGKLGALSMLGIGLYSNAKPTQREFLFADSRFAPISSKMLSFSSEETAKWPFDTKVFIVVPKCYI